MNKYLKIILSVLFVLLVAFLVTKSCVRVHPPAVKPGKGPARIIQPHGLPGPVLPAVLQPKMAIILDDWGYNLVLVKNAVEIGRPLTLSVLPHLPRSHQIAIEAKKNSLGVMLHMPMQPTNPNQPLEPRTIMTTTPDAEIIRTLDEALENVPEAEGVNNHQGSAATSDGRVMRTMLRHLKKRGLFFVDSEVIKTSVGRKVAQETGIAFTKRDVFLDNQLTVDAVKEKLRQAGRIALKYGRVIAIGHDKKITIQAIRETLPELEKEGVKLVLVKDLLD